ncbi:MAG TPA: transaldolase family protein, partial [Isosphaeraceae bacterium]
MATASVSPLAALQALGQSVWVDFMSRQFLENGELRRLIEEDGIQGVTSNPTIFEKAIGHSADYDADIRRLVSADGDEDAIYQELTVADIRQALDLFRTTYDRTDGLDGYVSLEVSPLLAQDSAGTLTEAKTLWGLLNRPNAMIKIPGTTECLPAI